MPHGAVGKRAQLEATQMPKGDSHTSLTHFSWLQTLSPEVRVLRFRVECISVSKKIEDIWFFSHSWLFPFYLYVSSSKLRFRQSVLLLWNASQAKLSIKKFGVERNSSGGTRDFKWRRWSEGFLGFKILNSGILLEWEKFGKYFLSWLDFNWIILVVRSSVWDFFWS